MSKRIIGLIPAAGKGVRLGLPYPKELYPVIQNNRYKPISQYIVENLTTAGVKEIVFVINETKHQLIGYFGNGDRFNCKFTYVVQETRGAENGSSSPGLAHALDSAYHIIQGKTVLFGMADTIIKPTNAFQHLLNAIEPDEQMAMGLFSVSNPQKFGMVDMEENGRIQKIIDKPAQTALKFAWGCQLWQPDFTEHLHNSVNEAHISDYAVIMNNAMEQGMPFRGVELPGNDYTDLGTYDEIMEMEKKYRIGL
jgi:glucose-1-phosphate thymidylyltransferase